MGASSRGEPLVLGLLLALGTGAALPAAAVVVALASVAVRWGAVSLGAIAGAQAVFGLAVDVGTTAAAASAWCAASAIVLAARAPESLDAVLPGRARLVVAVPFGVAAAAVAAGPGPGGALWWRVAASVGATACAAVVVAARKGRPGDRALGAVALAVALAALVLAGVG